MQWRVSHLGISGALLLFLGSCGMVDGTRDGNFRAGQSRNDRKAVSDLPVKIGAPYMVGGVTYIPADTANYETVGYASWYGEELSGNRTANGERFDPSGITAAHRTLPLPSYVEVTALTTGRTIVLRVNDRGPFTQAREIDLSRGAADQLGLLGQGAAPVRIKRVSPPEAERAILRSGRRVAERRAISGPTLADLRNRLSVPIKTASLETARTLPNNGLYTVQIAAFSDKDRAESLAARTGARMSLTDRVWRVYFGPYRRAEDARAGVTYAASKGFRDAAIVANDDISITPSR